MRCRHCRGGATTRGAGQAVALPLGFAGSGTYELPILPVSSTGTGTVTLPALAKVNVNRTAAAGNRRWRIPLSTNVSWLFGTPQDVALPAGIATDRLGVGGGGSVLVGAAVVEGAADVLAEELEDLPERAGLLLPDELPEVLAAGVGVDGAAVVDGAVDDGLGSCAAWAAAGEE